MDLTGKIAFVTGTRRLGRAVALALGRAGCDVALTYLTSRERAESAAGEIQALGRRALALAMDLAEPAQIETAVATAAETLGGIDVLVSAASIYRRKPVAEVGAADWDANMSANARGAYLTALACAPHMRRRGGGRIVNFADWLPASGRPRYFGYPSYYASKAAAAGMTEALALELARDGILVNAIAPGPVLPHDGITEAENAEVLRNTPLGRWGGEEAIVQAVLALLSCDFVTGEILRVDGGRHLR